MKNDSPLLSKTWISCNLAISADGKISNDSLTPSGWTSKKDFKRLIALRESADAILVGYRTLVRDQMTLVVNNTDFPPLRLIATKSGNIDLNHKVFASSGSPILILSEREHASLAHLLPCEQLQPHTTQSPPQIGVKYGRLNQSIISIASHFSLRRIHCEGGGELIRALAEYEMIDELHLTLAGHTLFSGEHAPMPVSAGAHLPHAQEFTLAHFEPDLTTGECYLSYRRKRQEAQ